MWSGIIPRRHSEFSRPWLAVLSADKTPLRLAQAINLKKFKFIDACAPRGIRTPNNSSEDCRDIHFTMGALLLIINNSLYHYTPFCYLSKSNHCGILEWMRKDKAVAFRLRKGGKSYRQIQQEINVSRSTLCNWFKNETWSKHIKANNINTNSKISADRLKSLSLDRKIVLENSYEQAMQEAEKDFHLFKKDPLFTAGLMIYAGEGDKRSINNSRVNNSEFYLHKIFIDFAIKYLNIKRENIKIGLILYSDLDKKECLDKWSRELDIPITNFYKNQFIKGKEKNKKLQYGVGISIISSTVIVKKKILKWLELCQTGKLL